MEFPQNMYWDQRQETRLRSEVVTLLHPGQDCRDWGTSENLKVHCGTAEASQGLGSPAADSEMPEAAGAGLDFAGAQMAGEAGHH